KTKKGKHEAMYEYLRQELSRKLKASGTAAQVPPELCEFLSTTPYVKNLALGISKFTEVEANQVPDCDNPKDKVMILSEGVQRVINQLSEDKTLQSVKDGILSKDIFRGV